MVLPRAAGTRRHGAGSGTFRARGPRGSGAAAAVPDDAAAADAAGGGEAEGGAAVDLAGRGVRGEAGDADARGHALDTRTGDGGDQPVGRGLRVMRGAVEQDGELGGAGAGEPVGA